MKTLVIIPAYNEEESIRTTVCEVREKAPWADILVVNDCSTDATEERLIGLGVRHLILPVNLGIGGAVQAGYRYALANGYEATVQLDGDGQHDPAYLETLIDELEKGDADLVTGSRFITREGFISSGLRRFGIGFLNGLIRLLCGVRVTDATSGFRAVSASLIALYAEEYPIDYPEPEAIVMARMHGARIKEIPVVMRERSGGRSSIRPLHTVYYMTKVSLAILLRRIG